MSQHDGVIANQGFPAFRSDLNDALAAIFSQHAGTARPTGAVAGQLWWDTDTPSATVRTLFMYDGTADIGVLQLDTTNDYVAKIGIGIVPGSMASGSMLHVKNGASGATANIAYDDAIMESRKQAVRDVWAYRPVEHIPVMLSVAGNPGESSTPSSPAPR